MLDEWHLHQWKNVGYGHTHTVLMGWWVVSLSACKLWVVSSSRVVLEMAYKPIQDGCIEEFPGRWEIVLAPSGLPHSPRAYALSCHSDRKLDKSQKFPCPISLSCFASANPQPCLASNTAASRLEMRRNVHCKSVVRNKITHSLSIHRPNHVMQPHGMKLVHNDPDRVIQQVTPDAIRSFNIPMNVKRPLHLIDSGIVSKLTPVRTDVLHQMQPLSVPADDASTLTQSRQERVHQEPG